jgi:3-hydroxyacyl-[acyl-carrier-protein] dehydratase
MMKGKIKKGLSLTIDEIMKYLEISPPFLMIDYIKDIIPGVSAQGVKNLPEDEWFFKCHLQRELTMPGTLQIEAMLQTLVLTIYTMKGHEGKFSYIHNIKTKLFSKISPGNPFVIHADLVSYKRGIATGVAVGKINDAKVCQGEFTFISPHDMPRPEMK